MSEEIKEVVEQEAEKWRKIRDTNLGLHNNTIANEAHTVVTVLSYILHQSDKDE